MLPCCLKLFSFKFGQLARRDHLVNCKGAHMCAPEAFAGFCSQVDPGSNLLLVIGNSFTNMAREFILNTSTLGSKKLGRLEYDWNIYLYTCFTIYIGISLPCQ